MRAVQRYDLKPGCKKKCREQEKKIRKKRSSPSNGDKSPTVESQILQRHPPSPRDVLLTELPDQGLRCALVLQEQTMRQDHHALLAPREHDICSSLVPHEPWFGRANNRNHDVVFLVSLERVDIEHGVLPRQTSRLERILDRVPLRVVRSDDLEVFIFSDITFGDVD